LGVIEWLRRAASAFGAISGLEAVWMTAISAAAHLGGLYVRACLAKALAKCMALAMSISLFGIPTISQ
jgi:hypothetical protein